MESSVDIACLDGELEILLDGGRKLHVTKGGDLRFEGLNGDTIITSLVTIERFSGPRVVPIAGKVS
ncbi:MAG: hypothetical protein ACR2RF_32235 [Geminicoccaceae bacterium]